MEKIVYLDYTALAIFVVLTVVMMVKGVMKSRYNAWYLVLMIVLTTTTAFDIFAVWGDNVNYPDLTQRYVVHIGYLIFHNITPLVYNIYLISQTDTWHRLWNIKPFRDVIFLPCIVTIAFIATTPGSKLIFYFNEAGKYTRGNLFILLYIQTAFYAVAGIAYVIYYRKALEKERWISLLVLYPIMGISVILQMLNPNHVLEMFAESLAMLYLSLMIHRPEERIDADSGFQSITAFKSDMARTETVKKNTTVIAVSITNYAIIKKMIGYKTKKKFQMTVGNKMLALAKSIRVKPDIYYLDRGNYILNVTGDDISRATELARLVNDELAKDFSIDQMVFNLVANVCTISYPHTINDMGSLMSFIEDLGSVNHTGSVLYASNMINKSSYAVKKNINSVIEDALKNGNLRVYYQPIYWVKDKKFKSAEALVRLIDNQYGFISPEIFIPAAEENGTIYRIGEYVLNEVCRFIASDDFKSLGVDYVEVNLSAIECMQDNLTEKILSTLDKYGIKTDKINLEITETAAVYSQRALASNLTKLTDAGIHFSLDDFGTGYSNLTRIATLPLSIIKLDKSFVNAPRTERMVGMIENTVRMIQAMKYEIVVEGIETEDMLEWYSKLGCDFVQGYYFSKPLPLIEYKRFLNENN